MSVVMGVLFSLVGIAFENEDLVPLMIRSWKPFINWMARIADLKGALSA